KKLISREKLKKRIKELGKEISNYYKKEEVVLLCILKGGFIFSADLMREISSPTTIDFLEASSYGDGKESSGTVLIKRDVGIDIKGKRLLIVEDIIDTGISLNFLLKYLKKKKPASIEICSLLVKYKKHKVKSNIRFVGFEIEDDFVVGYGMDYRGKYRNLDYIGIYEDLP
ncbi:MAG TPA: hypoxanthine phosphoribosyltransferase, partial [Leptospiraceae bacterium]|nr:hypoxanthine phosphoribosyltransferase [Leptospiraceae bacterium]